MGGGAVQRQQLIPLFGLHVRHDTTTYIGKYPLKYGSFSQTNNTADISQNILIQKRFYSIGLKSLSKKGIFNINLMRISPQQYNMFSQFPHFSTSISLQQNPEHSLPPPLNKVSGGTLVVVNQRPFQILFFHNTKTTPQFYLINPHPDYLFLPIFS